MRSWRTQSIGISVGGRVAEKHDVAASTGKGSRQAAGKHGIVVLDDGVGPSRRDVMAQQTAKVGVVIDDEHARPFMVVRLRRRGGRLSRSRPIRPGSGRPGPGTGRDDLDVRRVVVPGILGIELAAALGVVGALLLQARQIIRRHVVRHVTA